MKVYDNYEINPCRRFEEPDSPGKFCFEACEPHEAAVWTLYGHINGECVEATGDFSTREHAEEVFQRITGIPFAAAATVEARLRVMHAGQKLLEALKMAVQTLNRVPSFPVKIDGFKNSYKLLAHLDRIIADATGNSPSEPRKPIVVEMRGGVVQDVLKVPPGIEYEVKDYDDLEAEEEAAEGRAA